jgi:hypothetical protein
LQIDERKICFVLYLLFEIIDKQTISPFSKRVLKLLEEVQETRLARHTISGDTDQRKGYHKGTLSSRMNLFFWFKILNQFRMI